MASSVTAAGPTMTLRAYRGDAKTLLAFDIPQKRHARGLAGFTIAYTANGEGPFYLHNTLRFEHPERHAQDASKPANASINAPIHKFRWIHYPGSVHRGIAAFMGPYVYTVTPRFFDADDRLLPLDVSLSVSVKIDVKPFEAGKLAVAFTRGFTQSQAFVNHFGLKALIRPKTDELLFDTSVVSGTDATGTKYTFAQEYAWLGATARQRLFDLLAEVAADKKLFLDVFAYDLNEPDFAAALLKLAAAGRVRVILDDAALHHSAKTPKPEDRFEALFVKAAGARQVLPGAPRSKQPAGILRGKFKRYAHDKVLVVSRGDKPVKVLTGSTNFSVTGLYVNSNHVLIYSDAKVAAQYATLFETAWEQGASKTRFLTTPLSSSTFSFAGTQTPKTEITFAPHADAFAKQLLEAVTTRIGREGAKSRKQGSVLFAVMQVDNGVSPVWEALRALHTDQRVFSYGISDTTKGIALYKPGQRDGVLVTGKPARSQLPPPFSQVPNLGVGHQVHHKFVVCGFNGNDPVVYCGSSNLAVGGEQDNGDNLLAIRDERVAVVFAIEALALVDHFDFLGRLPAPKKTPPPANKQAAAVKAGWFLSTSDRWTVPYYDTQDLRCADRKLFA